MSNAPADVSNAPADVSSAPAGVPVEDISLVEDDCEIVTTLGAAHRLNIQCVFCERLTVPSLTCKVTDYRSNPPMARPEGGVSCLKEEGGTVSDLLVCPHPPVIISDCRIYEWRWRECGAISCLSQYQQYQIRI